MERDPTWFVVFSNVNPFKRPEPNHALAKKRRFIDPILTVIFFAMLTGYAVVEAMKAYDAKSFESVCYSTNEALPGGETTLKVKHLCYTAEKPEWMSFALKTFTCRGEHGGTYWAIAPSNANNPVPGTGNTPAPGGNVAPVPSGSNTPVSPASGSNTPAPGGNVAPAPSGSNTPLPPPASGSNSPVPPPPPPPPGGRLLQAAGQLIWTDQQPDFCAAVIHSGEAELASFKKYETVHNCQGAGCDPNVDTSKSYEDSDCTGAGPECKYYKIDTPQQDGFTCCGMRLQSAQGRTLAWLGTLGGFSGLLLSIMKIIPPTYTKKDDDISLDKVVPDQKAGKQAEGSKTEVVPFKATS
jgi:hypothetical protein